MGYIMETLIAFGWTFGGMLMDSEIKELNRMICNQCEEKEYEKCQACKIYMLVNKIAEH